ncbi:MAG: phosphotransferase family protein [Actinomycetota bacterium]
MDTRTVADRLAGGLGENGPVTIESCRRAFVGYRVGRRLRVVYRIRIDGRDHHVAASTFRSRKRSERAFRKALERGHHSGPLGTALHDPELNTVFWTFPNDRRIENLAAVADASPELTRNLTARWMKSRLVDYYPEVSAVVRCLDGGNRIVAYAKVHAGREGERTHRAQRAFVRAARASSLQLARPLGYSRQHQTLVVEPIAGRAIGSLHGQTLIDGLHAYGAALATLHSLPLVDLPPAIRRPLDRLQRKADGIRLVRPDIDTVGSQLIRDLSSRYEESAGAPVLVHGDTNVNNAILRDGRVTFIDFDRASVGSAGADVGNFLGLLRYFRLLGLLSPSAERTNADVFMRGYSSIRALPDSATLRVHISAALAERAFGAVNRLRARALPRVPALLKEANSLLAMNGRAL